MRRKCENLPIYLALTVIGATTIFPLLWMVFTSLKPPETDVSNLRELFRFTFDFSNYRKVLVEGNLLRSFLNSLFVTLSVTGGKVFTSSLAAYAFARMRFFGRDQIFLGYLMTLMIPSTVTMIPLFLPDADCRQLYQ